jgi:hypothetical protein
MTDFSPSYHEASHALAAFMHGLSMTHVSIREAPGHSLGRCSIQNGHAVDNHKAAVIMIAGHVGERMALAKDPRPNWFLDDDHDMESARLFIEWAWGDSIERQQDGRQLAQLQARSLLTVQWEAVQAIAERLQRNTTLLGDEVVDICKRLGVRRLGELTRAEAMKRMTPRGKQRLLGTVAADGKTRVEKAVLSKE